MKKSLIYTIVTFLFSGILTAQDFDRDAIPTPGPTPIINIAKPEVFKLANGLTVMIVENHKLPRISVSLSSDIPPFYEGNIVGVGEVMADQLGNGTTSISKDEFNERIDFLGVKMSFGGKSAFTSMLSKYFEEVMQLFSDAIINPVFSVEEVEKTKERMIEDIKSSEKSADIISKNVYPALMYGKNTGRGEFTTAENVKNITIADVKNAYKKSFSPENFYLVIGGDITIKEARKIATQSFSKWKKNKTKFAPLSPARNVEKTEINIVDVPSSVQSVIKIGNLIDLKQNDKDYFAASIANYILGGSGVESRLNMNLREKNAFTYGANSRLSTNKYGPEFYAQASVRNAVVPNAIKEFFNELNRVNTITEEELINAKARLKGSFIMAMENPEITASFAVNKITQDLPKNYYKNYLQSIDNVSLSDVHAAVKRIILPENSRIFIAGKATDFMSELEKLGYPIYYFDKEANPTSKPEVKKIAANVTVQSIGANYIKAIGGEKAISKINSLKLKAKATVQGMEIEMITINAEGGKSFLDMSMMGNSMNKMVFDGKDGYIQAQGQKMPIPEDLKEKLKEQQHVFPELGYTENNKSTLKGIEKIKDEDAYAILDGDKTSYYSIATGLKIAEIIKEKQGGQEIVIPTYFSNYKEVEGIQLPFTVIQDMMGQEFIFNVESYEFNTATDADFK